jgi:tetratricopeptide (TPR) repeat protein
VLEQGETKVGKQFLSQYRFVHALFQQFLYGELGSGERRVMHGQVAEALEQLYAEHTDAIGVELARHYLEAGDDEKGATYLIRAGDAAQRAYANAEARGFYAQALEALGRLPDTVANRRRRVDTLVKQVAVSLRSDGPDVNLERLKEAESLLRSLPPVEGDRERLAYIQYWTGHAYVHRSQPAEAIRYMRQVLAAAKEGVGGPELLAIPASVIGRALLVKGQFSEAEALLAQAIEPLANVANWHEWILAVGTRAWCLAALGQVQSAFAEGERALRKAEETGTLVGIAQSQLALAIVSWQSGEYERMRVEAYQVVQTSEKGGDRLPTALGLGFASWSEALLGNIDTAEELSRRSLSLGATIGPRLLLADWFAAARAEMALLGGRLDDAQARALEAVDSAHEVGSTFSEGLGERVWGRALTKAPAADWTEAEAHLAASLQAFEAGHAWLEAARTHVAWGQVLTERGNSEGAREHFEKAVTQFQTSGLMHELERTQQLVASLAV